MHPTGLLASASLFDDVPPQMSEPFFLRVNRSLIPFLKTHEWLCSELFIACKMRMCQVCLTSSSATGLFHTWTDRSILLLPKHPSLPTEGKLVVALCLYPLSPAHLIFHIQVSHSIFSARSSNLVIQGSPALSPSIFPVGLLLFPFITHCHRFIHFLSFLLGLYFLLLFIKTGILWILLTATSITSRPWLTHKTRPITSFLRELSSSLWRSTRTLLQATAINSSHLKQKGLYWKIMTAMLFFYISICVAHSGSRYLATSLSVVLDETNVLIGRMIRTDCLPFPHG